MRKTIFIIGVFIALFVAPVCQAATITYYYSEHCTSCQKLAPYWQQFVAENTGKHQFEKILIDSVEIKNEMMDRAMQYRGSAHIATPSILVTHNHDKEDVLLIGLDEVNHLPEILGDKSMLIHGMEVRSSVDAIMASNGKMSSSQLYPFTLAALADASNPCALFVFIVAVSYASMYCGRTKAAIYAVTFCATMFFIYFGVGLAGKKLIAVVLGASPWVTLVLAVFMLVLAVVHIRTGIFPDNTKYTELPNWAKELIIKHSSKCVSFWGAIVAGTLCAFVEMPCTGGPYIFALNIVSKMPMKFAAMWLVYYNLIFIFPLLICLAVLLIAPQHLHKLDDWRNQNRRWLHLLMGLLLFGAAGMVIANHI